MASVKQLILNHLATSLANITVANGYNTDIQKIISGKIFPLEKLPNPQWRTACTMIRFSRQNNSRDNMLSNNFGIGALAEYQLYACMSNASHESFMNFLDDIEQSVSEDPKRGDLDDTAYEVVDTWVDVIDIIGTEEFDEIFDDTLVTYKDQEAFMNIIVEYLYIPDLLTS
jgi:hypothetical protein